VADRHDHTWTGGRSKWGRTSLRRVTLTRRPMRPRHGPRCIAQRQRCAEPRRICSGRGRRPRGLRLARLVGSRRATGALPLSTPEKAFAPRNAHGWQVGATSSPPNATHSRTSATTSPGSAIA
jgi:hypothetical protein